MAEDRRRRWKGYEWEDGEEGKDGSEWMSKRERMTACGSGRRKGWQSARA